MKEESTEVLSLILTEGILEWFEATKIKEETNAKAKTDLEKKLYPKILYVYLDERLSGEAAVQGLNPNGYTEAATVSDYPVRNRKLELHVRRRRYLDKDVKSVWINKYKSAADGTRMVVEYGIFF